MSARSSPFLSKGKMLRSGTAARAAYKHGIKVVDYDTI